MTKQATLTPRAGPPTLWDLSHGEPDWQPYEATVLIDPDQELRYVSVACPDHSDAAHEMWADDVDGQDIATVLSDCALKLREMGHHHEARAVWRAAEPVWKLWRPREVAA